MKGAITYSDLLQYISEKNDIPKSEILEFIKEIVRVIRHGLERDGRVIIRGLGCFELRWQKNRQGRNPQTGGVIDIPAHSRVHFKPESALKRFINRKFEGLKPTVIAPSSTSDNNGFRKNETDPIQPIHSDASLPVHDHNEQHRKKIIFWLILALIIVSLLILFWPQLKSGIQSIKPVQSKQAGISETKRDASAAETSPHETKNILPAYRVRRDHKIQPGDHLWGLSGKYYQEVYLWPTIFRANQNTILDPDLIETGEILVIPGLENRIGELSEKEKRQIADGYMHVYFAYGRINDPRAFTYLWVARKIGGADFLEGYRDKINQKDLSRIDQMKGEVQLRL